MAAKSRNRENYIYTDVGFSTRRTARARNIARLGLVIFVAQAVAWATKMYFDGFTALLLINIVEATCGAALLIAQRRGWHAVALHGTYWLVFVCLWTVGVLSEGIGAGSPNVVIWWFGVLALVSILLFFDSRPSVLFAYEGACLASFLFHLFSPLPVPAIQPLPPEFLDIARPVSFALQLLSMLAITHTFTLDIAEAESQLTEANDRMESLLENMLPKSISQRLRADGRTFAESYMNVSVLFADIVGFTRFATDIPATELVDTLNRIFSRFDDITESLGLEKIKTIGDAYMVASGVPTPRDDHAVVAVELGLRLCKAIADFPHLKLRVGINSGTVVGGVIGKRRFIYDIWGDAVNIASRMESHGIPGEIQTSEATYSLTKDQFEFEERGTIEVKGKGLMKTYLLKGPNRAKPTVSRQSGQG